MEQLKSPTRVTCRKSSLIDHILTTFPERVSQQGIVNVGLSDHQLIYCTRELSDTNVGNHKQIRFRSLKNYTAEACKEALGKVYFPNYESFSDVIKLMKTSFKNWWASLISQHLLKLNQLKVIYREWFDGEVLESIALLDKLFKKFKRGKLNVCKDIYNKARMKSHRLILQKK